MKARPGIERVTRAGASAITRRIAMALGLEYLGPRALTLDSEFVPGIVTPVGSVRRGRPDVGDIDALITATVTPRDFETLPWVDELRGGEKQTFFVYDDGTVRASVNAFVVIDPGAFGAALMRMTGPAAYNIRLSNVAKTKGMKLSQHGLFDDAGKRIAGKTEREVQDALGVRNREPWDR